MAQKDTQQSLFTDKTVIIEILKIYKVLEYGNLARWLNIKSIYKNHLVFLYTSNKISRLQKKLKAI